MQNKEKGKKRTKTQFIRPKSINKPSQAHESMWPANHGISEISEPPNQLYYLDPQKYEALQHHQKFVTCQSTLSQYPQTEVLATNMNPHSSI